MQQTPAQDDPVIHPKGQGGYPLALASILTRPGMGAWVLRRLFRRSYPPERAKLGNEDA